MRPEQEAWAPQISQSSPPSLHSHDDGQRPWAAKDWRGHSVLQAVPLGQGGYLAPKAGWALTIPDCPPGVGCAGQHLGSGHGNRWRQPSTRKWCWSHPHSCSFLGPAQRQSCPCKTRHLGSAVGSSLVPAGADRPKESEKGPQECIAAGGGTDTGVCVWSPRVPAAPGSQAAVSTGPRINWILPQSRGAPASLLDQKMELRPPVSKGC